MKWKAPDITPVTYVFNWLALLGLTALTTAVAFIDLGPFTLVAAIGIACIKGLLIALIFMHLLHTFPLTRVVAISAVTWLLILLTLTFGDYITRGWTSK